MTVYMYSFILAFGIVVHVRASSVPLFALVLVFAPYANPSSVSYSVSLVLPTFMFGPTPHIIAEELVSETKKPKPDKEP